MDEQMIADAREWVVLPCTDRSGKHIASWDICTNQPEPDAIGVGVVASVYSGEETARAILAAVQAHSVMAGKVAELEADVGVKNGQLRFLADKASALMATIEAHGGIIVPHLLDTDDNPGQFLREAIESARAALAPYPERRSE